MRKEHLKFCEEYVLNFNSAKSYANAYNKTSNRDKFYIKIAGEKLLQNPKIVEKIKELEGDYRIVGHKMGLTKETVIKRLKELFHAKKQVFHGGKQIGEVNDNTSANKAIETYLKITGDLAPEKLEITETDNKEIQNLSKMSSKERKELKEKILRGLNK